MSANTAHSHSAMRAEIFSADPTKEGWRRSTDCKFGVSKSSYLAPVEHGNTATNGPAAVWQTSRHRQDDRVTLPGHFADDHQALLEIAGMALIFQFVVDIFAWRRRHQNAVYKLFEVVGSPFTRVRLIMPKFVLDRHIPLATFFLLLILWLVVLFELTASCRADPQQRACVAVQQSR